MSNSERMEIESDKRVVSNLSNEIGRGADVEALSSQKFEGGCHGDTIFSQGTSVEVNEDLNIRVSSSDGIKCNLAAVVSEYVNNERKVSRDSGIKLEELFQRLVSSHDWELAENVVLLGDPQTLNRMLCISLDTIWFLSTEQEMRRITKLIEKIIANGAYDFAKAATSTSFLASFVSACQSQTMCLADTATLISERLNERLEEFNGRASMEAQQRYARWAFRTITYHSSLQGKSDKLCNESSVEIRLQLSAFKTFLDLAGNRLNGKTLSRAFDSACFPLVQFVMTFGHGWLLATSATAIQGLLGLLVERSGVTKLNKRFLYFSRLGCTELVHILLQIARCNNVDVDVNSALRTASRYGKINMMECLVEEGNAMSFLDPLTRAAERGCIPVVEWFVRRGCCSGADLCSALESAITSSRVDVASLLLPQIPRRALASVGTKIFKAAVERSNGSVDSVAFVLHHDLLGDSILTYAVANSVARSDDEVVAPRVRTFLREHWSEGAFLDGMRQGEMHFSNVVQILRWGRSPICLRELPGPLVVAIAYLALYRECVDSRGELLSQRKRGELVYAARRLGGTVLVPGRKRELMAVLERHLPSFFLKHANVD